MQADVIPICRVCLQTLFEYIDMESSFYSDPAEAGEDVDATITNDMDSKKLTYMDCFRKCTRVNMKINCHLPQGMCVPCSLDLRFAYEFLKKAENAAQFYEKYAKKIYDELQDMQTFNTELSCTSLTMEETVVKSEEFIEKAYYRNDALSEAEECSIPKTQSHEDDTIDILELKHLISDEDNDQRDTLFEVITIDKERNNSIDQLNEHGNSQEERKSTINEDYISNLNAEKPKRMRKTNNLHGNKNVNSSASSNICKICNKNLGNLDLTDHMEDFHMYIEKCEHCEYEDKEFKVREHEELKHANKDKHLCYICSKTFSTLGHLNAHLRYHERKKLNIKSDACKTCGKTFVDQSYLRLHMQVHQIERKLYKCEHCDKLYRVKNSLNSHKKMHRGETIKCLECNKQFSRPVDLKIHMRFHTHEFPFECEVCGKKFAIKSHLRTHMWRHQGLKLQCQDCGKLFISSKALLEHSFTHTEMPFPCCYCPKGYPSKQKFNVHLKTAHSLQLNEEELRKIIEPRTPHLRKKLPLVQADNVMKAVEIEKND